MSNLIKFLESLGRDSTISADTYAATIAALDIDAAQREALMARDGGLLGETVTGTKQMRVTLFLDEDDSSWRDAGEDRHGEDPAADSAQLH